MPRGSNVTKGMRIGGRQKGTPNRATTERLERERIAQQAKQAVDKAHQAGAKLGKDVLQDFMHLFASMAATYQPLPAGMEVPAGRKPDEGRFLTYAKLACETARDLAAFQSPKFKAIQVFAPPPPPAQPGPKDGSNVVTLDDPAALARLYQNMVKRVG